MFFVYNIAITLILIAFWWCFALALLLVPKFRAGFFQKMGAYSLNLPKRKTIWLHAVSVGEVNAVEKLVKQLKVRFSDYNIVLSTVTKTGQEVANKKLSSVCDAIVYFPFDFFWSVLMAINAIKPSLVIIAETEIWPNFSYILNHKKIPFMIVNGRISPNSYKGYKNWGWFFAPILKNYTSILMQTSSDADRIRDIGASRDVQAEVMGNLKLDIQKNLEPEDVKKLSEELKLNRRRVLVAGSTHAGEDEIVLNVYEKLLDKYSDLKLIIAPRHPERYSDVIEMIEQTGYKFGLRSEGANVEDNDIIMIDTMGELASMYSICHLAFIGGSFSGTGGHNPLEATIYDKPTISGDIVFNFKDIYAILTEENASILVKNEEEFFIFADKLMSDADFYEKTVQNCEKVFEQNSGAVCYVLDKVEKILED